MRQERPGRTARRRVPIAPGQRHHRRGDRHRQPHARLGHEAARGIFISAAKTANNSELAGIGLHEGDHGRVRSRSRAAATRASRPAVAHRCERGREALSRAAIASPATVPASSRATSARRSSFPFALSGSAATSWIAAGTMWGGSRLRSASRIRLAERPLCATKQTIARATPSSIGQATAATWSVPATARRCASMSSSSTRWPWILIWLSARPR